MSRVMINPQPSIDASDSKSAKKTITYATNRQRPMRDVSRSKTPGAVGYDGRGEDL
jgi:hypothetical protein